ncbi:MAG: hypothetical protein FWD23_16290 [Oscillospiraceae bacterium]|nr:hypothetical protein [Oscillospiraceae bacterium]
MIKFHMSDILPLLPIAQPNNNRSSYYIPCPCCDGDKKYDGHLNINLAKDVFRCPRCNFSGGVLDLYSFYSGISRDEAGKAITARLRIYENDPNIKPKIIEQPESAVREYPLADVEMRNATYRALLNKLSLASDHKKNLLNRGLSEDIIIKKCYRTTPVFGWQTIARKLQDEGLYLSGIPGFYREDNGKWTFVEVKRGILIPVCDIQGRIQGLQIRRDDIERRKFRWISSSERNDGCRAEGWTHLAGEIREEILLIEGPMKADVVNYLTGITALSVPGVNSLTQLQSTLTELMALGLKRVMTCLDMDMMKNFYVRNGYHALLRMLDGIGLEFGTYLWNPYYNGLDDYVWNYNIYKK